MGIWEGIKRGSKAFVQGTGPLRFEAAGKSIRCSHCDGETFIKGEPLMASLGLNWATRGVTTLVCDECGLVQWFGDPPRER